MFCGFDGDYAFLSNYWECTVVFDGLQFRSVEAAYQAAKCRNPSERRDFTNLTPDEAKRLGREVQLRPDWERAKINIMRSLLHYKFCAHPDLERALLATGDKELVEGNTWGDTFWGVCNGVGENHLGRLLMEVREALRKKEEET